MSAFNYEELKRHLGHEIKCVSYGEMGVIYNVSVECLDCYEVLMSYENPKLEGKENEK